MLSASTAVGPQSHTVSTADLLSGPNADLQQIQYSLRSPIIFASRQTMPAFSLFVVEHEKGRGLPNN